MPANDSRAASTLEADDLQAIGAIVLAVRELMANLDREPTIDEIAAHVGMPADTVGRLVELAQDLDQ